MQNSQEPKQDIIDLIARAENGEELNAEEIRLLFTQSPDSPEAALILSASRRMSHVAAGGKAEVHAQVGLNIYPCPRNCLFCAFAADNGVFTSRSELAADEAITRAKQFETDGANAIFIMATADYSFDKYLEMSTAIRAALKPETVMIANCGDFTGEQASKLASIGYTGIYHAIRLGEGIDTRIPVEARWKTIHSAWDAGLSIGTCLEPVGPEHSIEELVEKTIITRDIKPAYSGSARRISIPGTTLAQHGMVSEYRMALYVAIVRLAVGYSVPGNCTHEPSGLAAAGGATLFWAESGANPRDIEEDTSGVRGMTVPQCREIFHEMEWDVRDGPGKFYTRSS